ncbi:MAG: hypothetical protein KH321_05710 [Clostridium sp.]|nr:hypothetical protein [Clostridium sp.]
MKNNSYEKFFEFTREHWQGFYEQPLSDDEVREIIKNFQEFYQTLKEKEAK